MPKLIVVLNGIQACHRPLRPGPIDDDPGARHLHIPWRFGAQIEVLYAAWTSVGRPARSWVVLVVTIVVEVRGG